MELKIKRGVEPNKILRLWLPGQAARGKQCSWPGPVPVPSWLASAWADPGGLSRLPVSLGLGFVLLLTEFFVPPSSTVVGGW